jgi:hypothetical protein
MIDKNTRNLTFLDMNQKRLNITKTHILSNNTYKK